MVTVPGPFCVLLRASSSEARVSSTWHANPSVSIVTLLQRVRDLAHRFEFRAPSVLLAVAELHCA